MVKDSLVRNRAPNAHNGSAAISASMKGKRICMRGIVGLAFFSRNTVPEATIVSPFLTAADGERKLKKPFVSERSSSASVWEKGGVRGLRFLWIKQNGGVSNGATEEAKDKAGMEPRRRWKR
ncbi:hypothetical protein NL676_015868 [Syzygium grande]|nr:hypothetical protein NL676_015868 [Syzygium grande]